jgi:hypothetical protein
MNKIELIEQAIEKAIRRESKLTPLAMAVPALSSLNIRHLMNNLGSISTRYLEHGVHKGGLFCSTIFKNDNLKVVNAVDSWASDVTNEDKAEPQFLDNVSLLKPFDTSLAIFKEDSFSIHPDVILGQIDLYLFDADHSEDSQCRALTHFLPAMADEFIFCVDDWDFPEVEAGTWRGLKESGVAILFQWIAAGNDHDNNGMWNGFAVFLLKKKP